MEIELTVDRDYTFKVKVSGVSGGDNPILKYHAEVLNAGLLSFWNRHKKFQHDSIEGLLKDVALELHLTIEKQKEM